MKCAILFPQVSNLELSKDDKDSLIQAEAVAIALDSIGWKSCKIPFSMAHLAQTNKELQLFAPSVVFNLVEEVQGKKELNYLGAAYLKSQNFVYTGCSAKTALITSDKLITKRILVGARVSTPAWISSTPGEGPKDETNELSFLLKPAEGEASQGLNEEELVLVSAKDALLALRKREQQTGERWLAEAFIDGREFNISVIDAPTGPKVLPPAEIIFQNYDKNRLRIVGYKAKWEEGSFEYKNTVRTFEFNPRDSELLDHLHRLTIQCWQLFELSGYARVDFRVDSSGNPWVLEINANPGIAPDSGLVAAANRAGLSYQELIAEIVDSAVRNNPGA